MYSSRMHIRQPSLAHERAEAFQSKAASSGDGPESRAGCGRL
jgi:hypothetical protein